MSSFNYDDADRFVYEAFQKREKDHIGQDIPKTKEEIEKVAADLKRLIDVALGDYLETEYEGE